MKYTVFYQTWKEIEILDEIMADDDEEKILEEIYLQIPDCIGVEEVKDEDGISIIW